MVDHVVEFDKYTEPMKHLLREFAAMPETATSSPRPIRDMVDGGRRRIRATCRSGRTW